MVAAAPPALLVIFVIGFGVQIEVVGSRQVINVAAADEVGVLKDGAAALAEVAKVRF